MHAIWDILEAYGTDMIPLLRVFVLFIRPADNDWVTAFLLSFRAGMMSHVSTFMLCCRRVSFLEKENDMLVF